MFLFQAVNAARRQGVAVETQVKCKLFAFMYMEFKASRFFFLMIKNYNNHNLL